MINDLFSLPFECIEEKSCIIGLMSCCSRECYRGNEAFSPRKCQCSHSSCPPPAQDVERRHAPVQSLTLCVFRTFSHQCLLLLSPQKTCTVTGKTCQDCSPKSGFMWTLTNIDATLSRLSEGNSGAGTGRVMTGKCRCRLALCPWARHVTHLPCGGANGADLQLHFRQSTPGSRACVRCVAVWEAGQASKTL